MIRLLHSLQVLVLRSFFFLIILMAGATFLLMSIDFSKIEPYIYPLHALKSEPVEVKPGVWVGGYLHGEELLEFLRKEDIRVVISLLNDRMYHEKRLIEYERRVLTRVGIRFVSVPMTPLLREESKLRRVKGLVRKYRKVYVHSYLGRLRTKDVLEAMNVR